MGRSYKIVIQPDHIEGGYSAKLLDLPGCITQADTWKELQFMVEDAKECWLEAALEDLESIPEPEVIRIMNRKYKNYEQEI